MSLPSYLYKCSECQRTFTSDDTVGHFSYQTPEGFRFPLQQRGGWCYACDGHVPIEDLRTEDLLQELLSLHQQASMNVGFFKSLSSSFKNEKKLLTDKIARLEARLNLVQARQSSPKCLCCGSNEVSPAPEAGMGCYYPGCNGTLQEQGEPLHVSLVFDHRVYNTEGQLMQVIEDW